MIRIVFLILILLINGLTYSQPGELYIPRDDGEDSDAPVTSMYVRQRNEISFDWGGFAFLNVKTNNGKIQIDTVKHFNYSSVDYYVIPDTPGKVTIIADVELHHANRHDTLHIQNTFAVLEPPTVTICVKNDQFRKNKLIILELHNAKTGERLPNRYKIGRLGRVRVYNKHHAYIDDMNLLNNEYIDFSMWHFFSNKKVKPGYIIEPGFAIRDTITGLLSNTEPFTYKIK